jgi:hypothetical protein
MIEIIKVKMNEKGERQRKDSFSKGLLSFVGGQW